MPLIPAMLNDPAFDRDLRMQIQALRRVGSPAPAPQPPTDETPSETCSPGAMSAAPSKARVMTDEERAYTDAMTNRLLDASRGQAEALKARPKPTPSPYSEATKALVAPAPEPQDSPARRFYRQPPDLPALRPPPDLDDKWGKICRAQTLWATDFAASLPVPPFRVGELFSHEIPDLLEATLSPDEQTQVKGLAILGIHPWTLCAELLSTGRAALGLEMSARQVKDAQIVQGRLRGMKQLLEAVGEQLLRLPVQVKLWPGREDHSQRLVFRLIATVETPPSSN